MNETIIIKLESVYHNISLYCFIYSYILQEVWYQYNVLLPQEIEVCTYTINFCIKD